MWGRWPNSRHIHKTLSWVPLFQNMWEYLDIYTKKPMGIITLVFLRKDVGRVSHWPPVFTLQNQRGFPRQTRWSWSPNWAGPSLVLSEASSCLRSIHDAKCDHQSFLAVIVQQSLVSLMLWDQKKQCHESQVRPICFHRKGLCPNNRSFWFENPDCQAAMTESWLQISQKKWRELSMEPHRQDLSKKSSAAPALQAWSKIVKWSNESVAALVSRWAPTIYKWTSNPYKWPYKWVAGVITLLIGVITPVISGRGPTLLNMCRASSAHAQIYRRSFLSRAFSQNQWSRG